MFEGAKKHRQVTKRPASPDELAKMVVTEYITHYADYDQTAGRSVDLSAIRLGKAMVDVGTSVTALAQALKAEQDQNRILLAHWYAQTYKSDQFVDVRDFCLQLQALYEKP